MEKRALIAIAISCFILIVWTLIFPPAPGPARAPGGPAPASAPAGGGERGPGAPLPADSAGTTPSDAAPGGEEQGAAPRTPAPLRQAAEGAPPIVVETDLVRVEFASPGASLVSWKLKAYRDETGEPYEIVAAAGPLAGLHPLSFDLEDAALEGVLNGRARFDVERRPIVNAEGVAEAGEEVRLVYSDGEGVEATKRLVFRPGTYLVEIEAAVSRNGAPTPAKITWGPGIGNPGKDDFQSRYYAGGTVVAESGMGAVRYFAQKVDERVLLPAGDHWVGVEEAYFAAVFIAPEALSSAEINPFVHPRDPTAPASDPKARADTVTDLSVSVPAGTPYTLFVGPKDYQLLLGMHHGLASLVNFSPTLPVIGPIVGGLAKVLYAALRWLHGYVGNYGLGIIILTTFIKIVFYPLTQRAMVKMRAVQQQMQKLQPKVTAIREKYRKAKDAAGRAKMNEDIMALYRREGVNPMAPLGGCLPLLLQLPILSGFYCLLTVAIELRQAPFFGWIGDLSRKDPYYVTPLLMGATMFLQQKMAMTKVTDPQQQTQQRIMLIMPVIFTYTFFNLPSGLVLYWLVNNVLGIVQQVLINRQARAMELAAAAAGKA